MNQKISILIPDNLHINQKNFSSFFKFVAKSGASTHFEKNRRDWIDTYGNYDSKSDVLYERCRILARLTPDFLYEHSVKGVNLFKIARAEILSRSSVTSDWYASPYPSSSRGIFDKLYKINKTLLMQNLAAAWDWLEFWSRQLADLPGFTHCCVFSGSLIYQRSLIELLKFTPTRVLLMESFLTGNDYYCEEKYEPISNNCNIRHKAVFSSLAPTPDGDMYDKERMQAINKLIQAKNKNVKQPESGEAIKFLKPDLPIVCIFGQVVNDFSLLEYRQTGLASIPFYEELIRSLVAVGFNVVFKAHPWEQKKNNVRGPLTGNAIKLFVGTLPDALQSQVVVVEDYPISELFNISSWAVGLNSQSLLEAAFAGFKPVQFGDAFFGGKGFTHDYSLDKVAEFVEDAKSGRIGGSLSLTDFMRYEDFLIRLLQKQLVSIHDSGVNRLAKVFKIPFVIALAKNASSKQVSSQSIASPKRVVMKANSEIANKLILSSGVTYPAGLPVKNATSKKEIIRKKLRKLKVNPRKFFADARHPGIRVLRHLF